MGKVKILLVDDEPDILTTLGRRLEVNGYDVTKASGGAEALAKIQQEAPDLVLLDVMMPDMDGLTVCHKLRERSSTCLIPVILLTARGQTTDKISGLKTGADDYITKPFDFDELKTRIDELLRRKNQILAANPLTGLPGNVSIDKEIRKRIDSGEKFAVCYLDINNFKSYNDKYGYLKGDQIISLVSRIFVDTTAGLEGADAFVGHIGGDDFILITTLEKVDMLCQDIIRSFDAFSPIQYSEADRQRGYIEGKDRQGNEVRFPLMSISISTVTNEKRTISHPAQVAEIAAEVKKRAKSFPGSVHLKDARKDG